jgi:hypothetical protein
MSLGITSRIKLRTKKNNFSFFGKKEKKDKKCKKTRNKAKNLNQIPPIGDKLSRLNFNSVESTKKSFITLMESLYTNKIGDEKARTLTYMVQTFLGIIRLEKELDLEVRIERLEKLIAEDARLRLVK